MGDSVIRKIRITASGGILHPLLLVHRIFTEQKMIKIISKAKKRHRYVYLCSPYVYSNLDAKTIENNREKGILTTQWSTVQYPSGEFLPTLAEDFYNEIKTGAITKLDVLVYTTTACNQDVLEIFFLQEHIVELLNQINQDKICVTFAYHFFHLRFGRLDRSFDKLGLDCVPNRAVIKLLTTMYEVSSDHDKDFEIHKTFCVEHHHSANNLFKNDYIDDVSENDYWTKSYLFLEKIKEEILKPHHFIVACDTGVALDVINLAGDNIMICDSLRTFEITQGKRLPQGHCFHDKRTRNFDWAVLKKVRTGVGETQIVGLEKTYDELCTLHDRDFVLIDDMVDGGNTLLNAVNFLHENGAKSIIACVTHGVLTGNAVEKITNCEYLDKLYISNSLPQKQAVLDCAKIEIIDIINSQISEDMARH
ncbi:phosphoribosyltransferase family protein [Romboutsia sp.]|uniref:phosphoribosyltransferase family protein n=1 Tax=Romboutsia sp. TaxID=1965302 RepID=UPI003F6801A1